MKNTVTDEIKFFVIIWNNPRLTFEELSKLDFNVIFRKKEILCFIPDETLKLDEIHSILDHSAGIVKRWYMYSDAFFSEQCAWVELLWTNSNVLWMEAKKKYWVNRFKLIDLKKSDLDVKRWWKEIMQLWQGMIWVVKWRQEIELPACIDFDKPVNGMQIWMMPAKLTKILVNLWKNEIAKKQKTLFVEWISIWDPFCWFGTTGFVVNAQWDNFIWSDINIHSVKQNKKWRMWTEYANPERHFTLFKHDVTEPFTQPYLTHVSCIVSEGWLWPVVKKWTGVRWERREIQTSDTWKKANDRKRIAVNIKKIHTVYEWFFGNIKKIWLDVPIVITLPHYTFLDDDPIYEWLNTFLYDQWFSHRSISIYKRKGQMVGRRVLIVT